MHVQIPDLVIVRKRRNGLDMYRRVTVEIGRKMLKLQLSGKRSRLEENKKVLHGCSEQREKKTTLGRLAWERRMQRTGTDGDK